MKQEQLKNKKVISQSNSPNFVFLEQDIKSAVEWLKKEIDKEFGDMFSERGSSIIKKIDQAFEDVVKK